MVSGVETQNPLSPMPMSSGGGVAIKLSGDQRESIEGVAQARTCSLTRR